MAEAKRNESEMGEVADRSNEPESDMAVVADGSNVPQGQPAAGPEVSRVPKPRCQVPKPGRSWNRVLRPRPLDASSKSRSWLRRLRPRI